MKAQHLLVLAAALVAGAMIAALGGTTVDERTTARAEAFEESTAGEVWQYTQTTVAESPFGHQTLTATINPDGSIPTLTIVRYYDEANGGGEETVLNQTCTAPIAAGNPEATCLTVENTLTTTEDGTSTWKTTGWQPTNTPITTPLPTEVILRAEADNAGAVAASVASAQATPNLNVSTGDAVTGDVSWFSIQGWPRGAAEPAYTQKWAGVGTTPVPAPEIDPASVKPGLVEAPVGFPAA